MIAGPSPDACLADLEGTSTGGSADAPFGSSTGSSDWNSSGSSDGDDGRASAGSRGGTSVGEESGLSVIISLPSETARWHWDHWQAHHLALRKADEVCHQASAAASSRYFFVFFGFSVNLMMMMEEAFGIEFDDVPDLTTIAAVARYLRHRAADEPEVRSLIAA